MGYTHEYSQYPNELISLEDFKNVDDTVGDLINQIETYRSQGNYSAAAQLVERYSDTLKRYNIDTVTVNTLIEEIRNTQIKALTTGQFLSYGTAEPVDLDEGYVWIGGE